MRTWVFLLGGMLVWTVHFFGIYGLASIFLTTPLARILTGILTLACLAAVAWLARRSWAAYQAEQDEVSGWVALLATLINAISFVAVLWQGFPAVLSGS